MPKSTKKKIELSSKDESKAYFSQNWFYFMKNDQIWSQILHKYNDVKSWNYLEIGSYEGMSAHWIVNNFNNVKLTCVDTFEGSEEHKGVQGLEETFHHNLRPFIKKGIVKVKKGMSGEVLRKLPLNSYDVIYVDGDHHSDQVLEDAVLSWGLLKSGGIMIFDDYLWHPEGFVENETPENERPKMGIAAFLAVNRHRFNLVHNEYQVMIEKI